MFFSTRTLGYKDTDVRCHLTPHLGHKCQELSPGSLMCHVGSLSIDRSEPQIDLIKIKINVSIGYNTKICQTETGSVEFDLGSLRRYRLKSIQQANKEEILSMQISFSDKVSGDVPSCQCPVYILVWELIKNGDFHEWCIAWWASKSVFSGRWR